MSNEDCWGQFERKLKFTWWVKVKGSDGRDG